MPKRTDQTTDSLAAAIRPLAEEVLAFSPHYLVEVHVRGHYGTRVVEVFVDSDEDSGLDALAEVSRELGFLLDVEDVVDGAYTLEVSSPGADRSLRLPRQYKKHVGRPLRVKYTHAHGADKIEGELLTAGENEIEIAAAPDDTRRIAYAAIVEARVLLPW